jgi:hypothetical protein
MIGQRFECVLDQTSLEICKLVTQTVCDEEAQSLAGRFHIVDDSCSFSIEETMTLLSQLMLTKFNLMGSYGFYCR